MKGLEPPRDETDEICGLELRPLPLAAAAFEVVDRQANLFQVVGTLRPPGRFPRRLHRGQQQGHQDADNGYHDQQLYQIKPDRFLDFILVPPHRRRIRTGF